MDKIYKKYVSTHYGLINDLNEKSLELSVKFYDRLYGKILPDDKTAKILDLGCGMGHFLYYLKKKGYTKINGIDICREQVELCKKHVTSKVECIDAFTFLNKTDLWDLVVMNDVLEHFNKDQVIALLELIYTKLNTGGLVVIKVPNALNPFSLSFFYNDFSHETPFTQQSLGQVLLSIGFSDLIIYGQPSNTSTIRGIIGCVSEKIAHNLIIFMWILQRFHPKGSILSSNIIAVGRKNGV